MVKKTLLDMDCSLLKNDWDINPAQCPFMGPILGTWFAIIREQIYIDRRSCVTYIGDVHTGCRSASVYKHEHVRTVGELFVVPTERDAVQSITTYVHSSYTSETFRLCVTSPFKKFLYKLYIVGMCSCIRVHGRNKKQTHCLCLDLNVQVTYQ